MGHSGAVPGALLAADIPEAMARLKVALGAVAAAESHAPRSRSKDDGDAAPAVSLRQRAFPLLELLSAAARQGCDVMWEEGGPRV